MIEYLHHLARYHKWRAGLFLYPIAPLGKAQLDLAFSGSFPTLGGLLQHIVAAETVWLKRLQGESPGQLALMPYETGADLATVWRDVSHQIADAVLALDERGAARTLHYTNTRGETFADPLSHIVPHIVDHTSYHTGQVVDRLRALGIKPPQTNMIFWLRDPAFHNA